MNKKRASGGFKGIVASVVTIVLLIAAVMAWMNVNNIESVSDAYGYFKALSDKTQECGASEATWNCDTSLNINPGNNSNNNDDVDGGVNADPEEPTITSPSETLLISLDTITIADPIEVEYDRSEWKHWTGSPCNAREMTLIRDGVNVESDPTNCKIISGEWTTPYNNSVITDSSKIDIDHVIPLSFAARHGGNDWSLELKEQFANDLDQLLATSATENRSKGDKGPGSYMPPEKDFHCTYSKIWVATAKNYELTITEKDYKALEKGLKTCDA